MQKFGALIRDNVYCFMDLQSDILTNILLLPKYTGELAAFKLVKTCLLLYSIALKWQQMWWNESKISYEQFLVNINIFFY